MRQLAPLFLTFALTGAHAQMAAPQPGQVVVSGTVQDEASKAGVLAKLRDVYGPNMVVDQISVGAVATPPNWNTYVERLITPELKQISRGQLKIDGSTVSMKGEVASEEARQKVTTAAQSVLNATFTISNGLRVSAADQGVLDKTLADRTIEFESGKATLAPSGRAILDEMAAAMLKLKERKVDLIGHTDNVGLRATNQGLSQARAEAVKSYLSSRGIKGDLMTASGQGPDRPVAANDTPDGRARNRRIEFRLAQ
jgi:OOP family OmpA-OmpF porin